MANRYAVATGNWNDTSVWSDSDGGTPGSSAPGASDIAYLTATSGAITVTVSAAASCAQLICTGYTGTLALGSFNITIGGHSTLASGMTLTGTTGALRFDGAGTHTFAGLSVPNVVLTAGGPHTLADALTVTGTLTVTASAAFVGAYDVSCATFVFNSASTFTFVQGQKLTVSSQIFMSTEAYSGGFLPFTMQSSTASSPAYIAYTGTNASTLKVAGCTFTDIDFSTYSTNVKNLDNWCGGTLTRTVGITNRTSASLPSPVHSEALSKVAFVMRDATTLAPATGKTVSCTRSLDGGEFAAGTLGGSGTATELSNGIYTIDFAAADMAGNTVTLRAAATGCEDTFITMVTAGGTVASGTVVGGPTKNVALPKYVFIMRDSTTHAPVASKTVTCTRSIDGAAFDAGTLGSPTEISNGAYYVNFGAGDLNGNVIVLRATASGCDDTFVTLVTGS